MKKHVILHVILLAGMILAAQSQNVGISAVSFTPDPQAMLDIQSTVAGLLVPRMTDVQRVAISPTALSDYGLLVYQTNTVSATNAAGYWYWDGTVWTRLFNGTSNGWSLTGNASTVPGTYAAPGTNFIGTTDAVDWAIRTGNTERMRVKSTGEIGINSDATTGTQLKVNRAGTTAISYAIQGNNSATGATAQYGLCCSKAGNMGAGTGFGIWSAATGTADYNYGGYFFAAGGTENYAVYGWTNSVGGYGVLGETTNAGYGVCGRKNGIAIGNGYAVYGDASNTGPANYGGYFKATGGTTNYGSYSEVTGAAATNYAAYASNSATGATAQYGVHGRKTGNIGAGEGYGVHGIAEGTAANNYGGYFTATGGTMNYGTYSKVTGTTTYNFGIYTDNAATGGGGNQVGIHARKSGNIGSGMGYGVNAWAIGTGDVNYGGYFEAQDATSNIGVYGTGTNYGVCGAGGNYGVYATANGGGSYAVYAENTSTTAAINNIGVCGRKTGNTSTGWGYGVYGWAGGTADYNVGGYFTASGATNNYSLMVGAGKFVLGVDGNALSSFISGAISVNPPSIAANTSTTFTVTYTGAQTTDYLYLTPPSSINSGLVFQGATITAANTITIRIWNRTGVAIDDGVINWPFIILRP